MKKTILVFFIILFLPINVFAYSLNLIPGGESIGIKINTDGLLVTGFYKVNDEYIGKRTFKVGDRIIKINGIIMTKLDSTSCGGSLVGIYSKLHVPIYFISSGESPDSLESFSISKYVDRLFEK